MPVTSKTIVAELRSSKNFMGTCPSCDEDFRLADASLFSLDDKPPEQILAQIAEVRARIQEQKLVLSRKLERMTKGAKITAKAVNLGKIVEKIVPSFTTFTYTAGDCRALFEPIDYLVFSGLTMQRKVDALYFVDVKSGGASLSPNQRDIKRAVEDGAVKFEISKS